MLNVHAGSLYKPLSTVFLAKRSFPFANIPISSPIRELATSSNVVSDCAKILLSGRQFEGKNSVRDFRK